MHQEFMYHHPAPLPLSLVQSFYYIAQQRGGLHLHFSGTKMDSLTLQQLHYQYNKYLCQDHHLLIMLCISVLLLIKLEGKLDQPMLALIFKVRDNYTVYNKFQLIKYLLSCTVVVPTKGPCAINNGGCDQICTDESGTIQCYCEAGYFSIAFLPTKCFGKSSNPYSSNNSIWLDLQNLLNLYTFSNSILLYFLCLHSKVYHQVNFSHRFQELKKLQCYRMLNAFYQ